MSYKKGDIVLIAFPFTDLVLVKKRPVLIVADENEYGDFVCFQITSKSTHEMSEHITEYDLDSGILKLKSYVKYDKCFTLNSAIIDKKLAKVNNSFMQKLKDNFCKIIL